jgi:hypothetical protein
VSEIDLRRAIALSLLHLKSTRRKARPRKAPSGKGNWSYEAITAAINLEGAKREGWENLRKDEISALQHGGYNKKETLPFILTATEAVLVADDVLISLAELEREYRHRLPELLKQQSSRLFEGDELREETADTIGGAWQFFYLSPLDRDQRARPQYRGIGVFVHQSSPNSRTIDFFVISGNSRWQGQGFINRSHLYLMCNDQDRDEAVFFLMNKPNTDQYLAGLGTGLERWQDRPIRPALGFFCFGAKWNVAKRFARVDDKAKGQNSKELETLVKRAVDKEIILPHEILALRSHFCKAYGAVELRKQFRPLYDYIQQVRINGETSHSPKSRPWLYLEWPT